MEHNYSDDVASLVSKIDREIKRQEQMGESTSEYAHGLQRRRAEYMETLRAATIAEKEAQEEAEQ